MINETELDNLLYGEITNVKSSDFGEEFYFSHKAMAIGDTWYKAHTDYAIENTSSLWFKESEIEWFEQDE